LDGVTVDDMQLALTIHCVLNIHGVVQQSDGRNLKGYAATVAIVLPDNRLMTLSVHSAGDSVDALAHEIAINIDSKVLEGMRRGGKPSSSPKTEPI
jgi:hypothetical protein